MIAPTVFYSWQSDLPDAVTKTFVRTALSNAVESIDVTPELVDSPRLDHDTQGVAGTPEIAGTIFRKIERSAVFVADVSITQESNAASTNKKASPNPNVMLELGYAAATIGWDRIVLVMNERFGGVRKLPFDLRNRRWPTTFSLSPQTQDRERTLTDVEQKLKRDVTQAFAADYRRAEDAIAQLAPHARRLMKKFAVGDAFSDGGDGSTIMGRDDFHCQQLLNLGILQTVQNHTELQFHYAWTYLGRECCRRLGVAIPPDCPIPEYAQTLNVIADMSALDGLDTD